MEMSREMTAQVLENILKHGRFNIPTRNAIENAVRHLTPLPPDMEGGGSMWYPVCGECHTYIEASWKYCPYCGQGIGKEV